MNDSREKVLLAQLRNAHPIRLRSGRRTGATLLRSSRGSGDDVEVSDMGTSVQSDRFL